MHSSPPDVAPSDKDVASAGADVEKEARDRVAELRAFHTHLMTFIIVHAFLVGIYLISGADHFWPIYPMFGWGIGLASHAFATFGMFGMFDKSWEERKVREIVLQKEHGLSAEQVRALLKQEMAAQRPSLSSTADLRRIEQRLQNLEAIVTGRDWDELPSHSEELRPDVDNLRSDVDNLRSGVEERRPGVDSEIIEQEAVSRSAEDAARLARRVR